MFDLIPLELLSNGQRAEVADVSGENPWVCRLAEMGLRIGSRIRVLQAGVPCMLEVGEFRLSLRGDDSARILVRPVAEFG